MSLSNKDSHDVAPKTGFQKTFDRIYEVANRTPGAANVNTQEIALLYVILAHGTMYNIEMAHNDPSAEEWLRLSEWALVKGDFLTNNTVPGLQTLVSL